ncbi:hypothetical protein WEH80_18840 [Actinomycetes bacterium KLBMP 9759]
MPESTRPRISIESAVDRRTRFTRLRAGATAFVVAVIACCSMALPAAAHAQEEPPDADRNYAVDCFVNVPSAPVFGYPGGPIDFWVGRGQGFNSEYTRHLRGQWWTYGTLWGGPKKWMTLSTLFCP